MSRIDYTRRDHLEVLAEEIGRLSNRQLAELNAFTHAHGLMRTHRPFEWMVAILARWKRLAKADVWFAFFLAEELNTHARDGLIAHLLDGRDATDPFSAGGFSEVEVHSLVGKLTGLGRYLAPTTKRALNIPDQVQAVPN